jgi:hypothetical protein
MNSASVAPRFVPTLTDVVHPVNASSPFNPKPAEAEVQYNAAQLEDQLIHRVMQRVDLILEKRLREAVAQVILSHTQALEPHLHEEIERVVRESVRQALAQELPLGSP